jgi:C1A family cysteine protease
MKHKSMLCLVLLLWWSGAAGRDAAAQTADNNAARGCVLDTAKFHDVSIFPMLSDDESLPPKISLAPYAPKPKDQGQQSSCVGFSTAYAARTILETVAKGVNPNQLNFSPAFVFNQINQNGCEAGSCISDALDLMKRQGVAPLSEFPYDDKNCDKKPDSQIKTDASNYKIKGYTRLTSGKGFNVDLLALKQNLAKGAPVVIAMPVGGSFEKLRQRLWSPNADDYNQLALYAAGKKSKFGGHAMCAVGYDDESQVIEIMNSWGDRWGDKGFFTMSYTDFTKFCREAYGLFPLAKPVKNTKGQEIDFKVTLGFVEKKMQSQYMPLAASGDYQFTTTKKQQKGTKFKIELTNSVPCYAYVLGQETDGTSYILFPYTKKHSTYFGITGKRVFPEGFSLVIDNVGKQDYMAVILSKEELDIYQLNEKISSSKESSYAKKVTASLRDELVPKSKFTASAADQISLEGSGITSGVIPIIVGIDK